MMGPWFHAGAICERRDYRRLQIGNDRGVASDRPCNERRSAEKQNRTAPDQGPQRHRWAFRASNDSTSGVKQQPGQQKRDQSARQKSALISSRIEVPGAEECQRKDQDQNRRSQSREDGRDQALQQRGRRRG